HFSFRFMEEPPWLIRYPVPGLPASERALCLLSPAKPIAETVLAGAIQLFSGQFVETKIFRLQLFLFFFNLFLGSGTREKWLDVGTKIELFQISPDVFLILLQKGRRD